MADPEKSKIKPSSKKIPILFMSDWGDTGFGTVGQEICGRLAEMEIFDVHYLGWFAHATENAKEHAAAMGYTLHSTGGAEKGDHFGNKSFTEIVQKCQPKAVLTLGDPWMIAHVHASPLRDNFIWLAYIPIDRDYVSRIWTKIMRKPDVLVLYSQFGVDVINEMIPLRHPELILHGIDRMVFKPWYPDGMDKDTPLDKLMQERKRITLREGFKDSFVVGFVGRNQIRKGIPRSFRAFKAFNCSTYINKEKIEVCADDGSVTGEFESDEFCNNKQKFRCDVCPAFRQRPETEHSILYLHTTPGDGKDPQDKPGIGWLIEELGDRYRLHGRMGMTTGLTPLKGVPRAALAQIYNCFDVHLFLSHSEGFGLPIAEGLACGVPTIVTDYSSMPELISDGGGFACDVIDYDTFVTWENDWASADIGHAARLINDLFVDKELYAKTRQAAADSRYIPDWDGVACQFRDLILTTVR